MAFYKNKNNKYVSKADALDKLQHYCAYQDRCHQEVKTKLISLGIYGDDLGQIMAELIEEDFLNEERFARSYARGKFRMKKWGKQKITRELKSRKISIYCIKKAMTEIDAEEYESVLYELLEKKFQFLRDGDIYSKRKKLFNYAYQKGFESKLIQNFVKDLTSESF